MAAKDVIAGAVKQALEKAGWTITADPYIIKFEDATLQADLAAEPAVAAELGERKIIIEVKSFLGPSAYHDFELAVGQFVIYRTFLEATAPERELFLAVGDKTYQTFFLRPSVQYVLARNRIKLLVVKLDTAEVLEWTN